MGVNVIEVLNEVFLGSGSPQPVPPVNLPDDECMHQYPVEWWYFIGHLRVKSNPAERYAFEMTALRLRPRYLPLFDTCYLAIIDLGKQDYVSADRQSENALDPAPGDICLRFGPPMDQPGTWVLQRRTTAAPAGYHLEGAFQVDRRQRALRLDLAEKPGRPVLYHGNSGVLDLFGLPVGYYSRTRLDISGGLKLDGHDVEVAGEGWMDHEYGTGDLPNTYWTFVAVELDSGDDICAYQVYRKDPPAAAPFWGYLIDKGNLSYTTNVGSLTPFGGTWGPWGYPLKNHVALYFGGGVNRVFDVVPEFDDQRRIPTGRRPLPYLTFWEGAAKVLDGGGNPIGRAFLELAGYE